jgi:hypothetical protein
MISVVLKACDARDSFQVYLGTLRRSVLVNHAKIYVRQL